MKFICSALADTRIRQFLLYAVCGGTGVLLDLCIYLALIWPGINYQIANAAGYLIGTLASFALNRHFTFQTYDRTLRRLGLFVATALVGYAVSSALLWVLVSYLSWNPLLAKLATLAVVLVLQFHPTGQSRSDHRRALQAMSSHFHTAIIGGGFAGLSVAYELAKQGKRVIVVEREHELGGLAGGFKVGDQVLEKFYHHWFNNDLEIFKLIGELGANDNIVLRPTRTGMYFADQFYRLSTPLDLLRFDALPLIDRIRLGVAVLRARSVRDWKKLENLSAKEWLIDLCGEKAYKVVWDPLLVGKFGDVADDVSAVWFWKKLVLRGGSRSSSGDEVLAYYRGGFAALAEKLGEAIVRLWRRSPLRHGGHLGHH